MATLYISEFAAKGRDGNNNLVEAAMLPEVVTQTVAVSGSSAASAAFNALTGIVRLVSDATCSIVVGPNPTATTTSLRLFANQPEYFSVKPGNKIAVISNT